MAKIKIITYGCSANQADSEAMAFFLEKKGHELVDENQDLTILNTCTVKSPTENKILKKIKELDEKGEKIIVSGCIPQAEKDYAETKLKKFSIVGVFDIDRIAEAVEKTLGNKRVVFLSGTAENKRNLERKRRCSLIEILPISEGCLGNCAYCKTKQARGNLVSFNLTYLVKQARKAIKSGAKEIWITSQDTGCYGYDIGETLPKLIEKITKIKGDFRIRIGMMNPNFAKKILPELIKVLKNKKVFKFIHIPVQSGNNRILKKMNRNYFVENFKEIITQLRKKIPEISIATDVILGFPGETKESFMETVELINWLKPDVLNISRYWERPGTESAKMSKKLHTRETKELSRQMSSLFKKIAFEKNKKQIGKEYFVFVDEIGKKGSFISRNDFYKPIVIKSNKDLLGNRIKVKITKAKSEYLISEKVLGK